MENLIAEAVSLFPDDGFKYVEVFERYLGAKT